MFNSDSEAMVSETEGLMPRKELRPGILIASAGTMKTYKLVRMLGTGDSGDVWLCWDVNDSERRAVKIFWGEVAMDVQRTGWIHRRAEEAVGCYVPKFYEASFGQVAELSDAECAIIVMQYVDGEDLRSLVLHRPEYLAIPVAKVILHDVAFALRRLHRCGLIHRDIKPESIIVARNGYCFLCSFGLTLVLEERLPAPAFLPRCGSPLFMSPEMCFSEEDDGYSQYCDKVDVWAFGITACFLATGSVPEDDHPECATEDVEYDCPDCEEELTDEESPSVEETYRRIIENPAPRLPLAEGIPTPFNDLVARCLERDPDLRISSDSLPDDGFLWITAEDRETASTFMHLKGTRFRLRAAKLTSRNGRTVHR